MHRAHFLVKMIQDVLLCNIIFDSGIPLSVQRLLQSLCLLLHGLALTPPPRRNHSRHGRLLLLLVLPLHRLRSLAHTQADRHREQFRVLLADPRPDLVLTNDIIFLD